MRKHGIPLRRQAHNRKLSGQPFACRNLYARKIIHACIARITAHAISKLPNSFKNSGRVRHEALPQDRYLANRIVRKMTSQTCDEQRAAVLQPRSFQLRRIRSLHLCFSHVLSFHSPGGAQFRQRGQCAT